MRFIAIPFRRLPASSLVRGFLASGLVLLSANARALPPQPAITGLPIVFVRDARIGDQRVGILTADWLYCYPPTSELILVPRGYVTDFASIPFPANHLIDRYGDDIEGSVVHDWLYAVGEADRRAKADEILRYALMEQRVDVLTRNTVYSAVRAFGSGYGAPKEWRDRWGDPAAGTVFAPPRVAKPRTAVVGKVNGGCARMEQRPVLASLLAKYASDKWPKP